MNTAAEVLGEFAAGLTFEDIPSPVVERAKDCIIDSVAAARFGAQFPWSRKVLDYALRYGTGGGCTIIGTTKKAHAPYAAMANGVHIHAFEQDNSHHPNVGAHGGATVLPAVLAACEEAHADGKMAITAFVAGCEVMFRIGAASRTSSEGLGFHAPGITGPYGAAIAAGRVFGLDGMQLAHALGIAGSLSSGLLAFTKSKQGGMIKRLHLGRSAESGILAARLAGLGYSGPETILEGKFGYLDTYCEERAPELLTKDLYQVWETSNIKMKCYSSQGNTHTAMQSLRELIAEHAFRPADVESILVEVNASLLRHDIKEPGDISQAQYSIPFCLALSLFRDPEDPNSFLNVVGDASIRGFCKRVEMRVSETLSGRSARVTVCLEDGRKLVRQTDSLKGRPSNPLSREDLRRKLMFTAGDNLDEVQRLFERLEHLEKAPNFLIK